MFSEGTDDEVNYDAKERWRIVKNILVVGFAFMIHFTAFQGASNLQSSINTVEALGTFTLASIYGSLILSNIFLPAIIIRWLGCKWTIAISFTAYIPFILAQFYPKFYTMIPGGLAVGLGGGPLWCAKCTYLSLASEVYSKITNMKSDVVMVRFFGLFFMFYQFAQVWGNLISSSVLSTGEISPNVTLANRTDINLEAICGSNFCPGVSLNENPNLVPPDPAKIQLISAIYLGCMVSACLIVAFGVDSLSRYKKQPTEDKQELYGFKLLAVTVEHLKNPYQILILPITMFIGAEQAFMAADFNASFVSCGWGIQNIGFVMICFGISNAFAAIITGSVVKLTGRYPVVIFATILHILVIVILLRWQPDSSMTFMYFLMSGLWGMADALWLVQINALSGILFPGQEEAAYSNFRLWEATGSVIAYAYSPYLCTDVKLYFLLGLLLLGVTGYATVECMESRRHKSFEIDLRKKLQLEQTLPEE